MASIRRRLTIWYSIALVGSMLAFATALVLDRRHPGDQELDQRLAAESGYVVRSLSESFRVLGRITSSDSVHSPLAPSVGSRLEGVPYPLVVVGPRHEIIFLNESASRLDYYSSQKLAALLRPLPDVIPSGTLELDPVIGRVRYLALPVGQAGPDIAGLVLAIPVRVQTLEPTYLLRSMLVIAPLILLGALGIGYWLAGTALRPIAGIMDEVEAITDGRSLHHRVVVPRSGEELVRLAQTVNRMLERLEDSFTSLRRFTADASHELKTPLMVLRAGVERALTHPGAPPEALQALDETLEQINQMAEMVDNLLTLARADEGSASLAVEDCDLRDLVAEAAETAGILGEEPAITVRTELPPTPVTLAVDRSRIRQLLLNLITNAIKYTPNGGKVSLALVDQGDTVALIIGDSGIGIAPADLPNIFDRFFRADIARARTGDRPGTGLGLAITKWIAEAHGGTITVQSRLGRGTVFTVTLPRVRPSGPGSLGGLVGLDGQARTD